MYEWCLVVAWFVGCVIVCLLCVCWFAACLFVCLSLVLVRVSVWLAVSCLLV